MKTKTPKCPRRISAAPEAKPADSNRSFDPRTTQACHQLRRHAEGLALELAVRLRVLGKSLAAACPGPGGTTGNKVAAYQALRLQFDDFLGALVASGLAEHVYLPVVRNYLQDSLPFELSGCSGKVCRVAQIETVVSLLVEGLGENEDFSGVSIPALSF